MALPTASDNPFPSFLAVETAAASISSPASGKQRLFIDTDHVLKYKDSGGTVSSVGIAGAGASALVYRYTVAGSDKTSIDTGVDTPDAGSNVWSGGDLLEIFVYARTDEAVAASQLNYIFNNDATSIYDVERLQAADTSVSAANSLARANFFADTAGSSAAAGVFGTAAFTFPNFAGLVGNKVGQLVSTLPSESAGSTEVNIWALGYRSTSALTRFAVSVNTGAKKLKVGSQLLIYKRTSS